MGAKYKIYDFPQVLKNYHKAIKQCNLFVLQKNLFLLKNFLISNFPLNFAF